MQFLKITIDHFQVLKNKITILITSVNQILLENKFYTKNISFKKDFFSLLLFF